MDGYVIGPLEQFFERYRFQIQFFQGLRFDVGIKHDDLHLHSLCPVRYDPSDLSGPDQTQCLVVEFPAL